VLQPTVLCTVGRRFALRPQDRAKQNDALPDSPQRNRDTEPTLVK